jgi:hypothetical protein
VRRLIVLLVAVAVLAPVAAFAGSSSPSARSDCAKLRTAMGVTAFAPAYTTFGACVSRYAPIEQQVTSSAQVTCTAQQADPNFAATHGGKTFDQYYGSGKKNRNAFNNCVSIVAKANRQAEQQGRLNPAHTCRALRTQLGAPLFDQSYGKNKNDRNAFGKCVSAPARVQAHNELSSSTACATEQSDPNFAGDHGGQTFYQYYGTNADQSNAFGMCVSSTAKTASTAHTQAVVHAALTCKSQRKSTQLDSSPSTSGSAPASRLSPASRSAHLQEGRERRPSVTARAPPSRRHRLRGARLRLPSTRSGGWAATRERSERCRSR